MKTYEQFNQKKPEIERKFHEGGQIKQEFWLVNNELHREDGPAFQEWYENGQKESEQWYLNGKKHREDGPAIIVCVWNYDHNVGFYYLNNNLYSREDWLDKLKEINSPHYEEQSALYDAEKYNI